MTNLIADHREDNPYRKALVRELVAYNDQHAPLENWQYVGFYVLGGRPRRSRPRRTRSYASRETMKGGSGSSLAAPSRLRERPETALTGRYAGDRRMRRIGRVGKWRGGGRSGMSVSAPFVWRCLSGSTMAPFPLPSHRTGHADFPASGSRTRPHAFAHGTPRPSRPPAYEPDLPRTLRQLFRRILTPY